MGHVLIDKRKVRYQFGRAARRYDSVSAVQQQMADSLLQEVGNLSGMDVIDLGIGTGHLLCRLEQLDEYSRPESLTGVDISTRMLAVAGARLNKARLIAADMDCLPIASASFDCVLSNAALQWCDLHSASSEMRRLLRPDGRLLITTFGPSTLREWKLPEPNLMIATTDLAPACTIETTLNGNGFRTIEIRSEIVTQRYRSIDSMFSAIRDLGATFANQNRQRGLMGKSRYARIRSVFEKQLQNDGSLSLTFEPILITARC